MPASIRLPIGSERPQQRLSALTYALPHVNQDDAPGKVARAVALAPAFFVWMVWAGLALGAFLFVGRFGVNVPFWDEWDIVVPGLTGERPCDVSFLWSQYNEHRFFLPRLVFLGLLQISDHDFRSGMIFSVAVLSLLAAAMMFAARQLRGRWSFADAFFPIVLLHWGHCENMLMGFQVAFICPAVLAGMILLIMVKCRESLSLRKTLVAGVCLLLLPLCGASGLALVPALSLWLAWSGARQWPAARTTGIAALVLSSASLLLTAFYFVGYQSPRNLPMAHSLVDVSQGALQLGVISFGPAVASHWEAAGWLLVGILMSTLGLLAGAWFQQPSERLRATGLLLFLAAFACLAVGIGWGRSSIADGACLVPRYVTIAVPMLCAVWFAWRLYGGSVVGQLAAFALLLLASFLLWGNMEKGREFAQSRRHLLKSFEHDLRAGMPVSALAERYAGTVYPHKDILVKRMTLLHQARIGLFRHLQMEEASAP